MSWRTTKDISERAEMPRSLEGCDKVEEGSGGSWALPACQGDWRAVMAKAAVFREVTGALQGL